MNFPLFDLHNHLLPLIDDGPNSMDETIKIVELSEMQGVRTIIATPHKKDVNELHSIEFVRDLLKKVNQICKSRGYSISLKLGMENHLDSRLLDDIKAGKALPIGDSKYILLEMPYDRKSNLVEDVLGQIQNIGLIPIIAHPERMELFQYDPGLLFNLVEGGMLTQITASSVYGKFGDEVQRFTEQILRCNLGHILASDAHMSTGSRPPDLLKGYFEVSKIIGRDAAKDMVSTLPRMILDNNLLDLKPPILIKD